MRRPSRKEDSRGRRSRTLCLYCLRRNFLRKSPQHCRDCSCMGRQSASLPPSDWTEKRLLDTTCRPSGNEAGIDFRIADEPYVYLDLAHASQSHVIFLAAMESPEANPGPESFEARLFSEDEIPWDKIAFNSVDKILRLYFDDAKTGNFPFHYIERHKQGKIP